MVERRDLLLPLLDKPDERWVVGPVVRRRRVPGVAPVVVLGASQDRGRTWEPVGLPSGAGQYPQVNFFTRANGVLVTAGPQQALGAIFYLTADGGKSWTPVPQGTHFTQYGEAIDFASPQAGFAWNSGGDTAGAASLYATTDSGRTWRPFTPHLVTG